MTFCAHHTPAPTTSAEFADFSGANLRGADLSRCELAGADFNGADLTGANLTLADLQGAKFTGITGRDAIIGLDQAVNVKSAHFD